jgi:hypothetical protein
VHAANFGSVKTIISVDTLKPWIDKVSKSLESMQTTLLINYFDLGEIGDWGVPINRNKSQNFWRYMVMPWEAANSRNLIPDTILIDGRFRVASFLYSLLSSRVGTLIMFDDYLDREHYFVVEKFCKLQEKHGRMGVFYVEHKYSVPELVSAISNYSNNWA